MTATGFVLTPADSARAVAQVYTISLAAAVPLVAAAMAAIVVRRHPAGTRALVWRGAVVALLVVFVGHLLPLRWMAWVLPGALASPLVALGRLQVAAARLLPPDVVATRVHESGAGVAVSLLLAVYVVGIGAVASRTVAGWLRVRKLAASAHTMPDARVLRVAEDGCRALGIRRRVRVLLHADVVVPAACGILRPMVLLPVDAASWDEEQLRAAVLHELAHVAAHDVAFLLASRVVVALYWWNPAAWWAARCLRAECELACDDRVLATGMRPSSYASLLVRAADVSAQRLTGIATVPVLALSSRSGLRQRLAAIVDTGRDLRAPGVPTVALAIALSVGVAVPASVLELAPTRGVLTGLMADGRWDSRAYAVLGLAQRADSVAVARAAAAADPSPRVRAWARLALAAHDAAAPTTLSPAR